MSSCHKVNFSVSELAEKIRPLLDLDEFVKKRGGTLDSGTLIAPRINGTVLLDDLAKDSLCTQLAECIRTHISNTTYIDNGELDGTTLVLKQGNAEVKRIPLGSLIPVVKADRFLSKVDYKPAQKVLEFVTSASGEADKKFTVPLDDLLNVSLDPASLVGTGLELRDGRLHVKQDLQALVGNTVLANDERTVLGKFMK